MHIFVYILFLLLSACGTQLVHEPTEVSYQITPQPHGFLVEIKHNADHLRSQVVPEQSAYALYQPLLGNNEYPIRYFILPKQKESTISDTFINNSNGFFQTTGHGLLACAGSEISISKTIQITWNAPASWQFANSFSAGQKQQRFEASCDNIRNALYVGGYNFNLHKTSFGALAIAGQFQNFSADQLANTITENMKLVEGFWKTEPETNYFVSIRSISDQKHGGTAQFRSFQLQLSPNQQMGYELNRLIAHEYFHHWNGLKIKPHPQQNNLDISWFLEGFTDYYAYLLTAPDIASYQQSFHVKNFKNIGLAELKRNSLNNSDYFHVPYVQGRRIAAWLDKKINQHSGKRLEQVMHELLKQAQDPSFFISQKSFLNTLCRGNYMSCAQAEELLQTYVLEGVSDFKFPTNPLI